MTLHGIECDQPIGVIGDGSSASKEDEFLKLHPKKTIKQLHQAEDDGVIVVCAKVLGFVSGVDWWYPACRCHRAVTPDSGLYYCGGCYRHVMQVVPRLVDKCFILYCIQFNVVCFTCHLNWATQVQTKY